MNKETGEIKPMDQLTEKEKKSGKWTALSAAMASMLLPMSPRRRLKAYRASAWQDPTRSSGPSHDERKRRRKAQKLARRRNRK